MKEILLSAAGVLLSLGCVLSAAFFLQAGRRAEYKKAFLLKSAAGGFFLLLGLLNFFLCPDRSFAWKILGGLALGVGGDSLLAMRYIQEEAKKQVAFFTWGACSFAVGHMLYIMALLGYDRGAFLPALPVFMLGLGASLVYLRVRQVNAGRLQIQMYLYVVLVVLMAAIASSAAVRGFSIGLLLFGAGGICFAVSDNLLCAHNFGAAKSHAVDRALHISYYTAQLFIAWSLRFL